MIEIDLRARRLVHHIPILDPYNVSYAPMGRYLYKVAYRYTFVELRDAHTFRCVKRLETSRQPSHIRLTDARVRALHIGRDIGRPLPT